MRDAMRINQDGGRGGQCGEGDGHALTEAGLNLPSKAVITDARQDDGIFRPSRLLRGNATCDCFQLRLVEREVPDQRNRTQLQ